MPAAGAAASDAEDPAKLAATSAKNPKMIAFRCIAAAPPTAIIPCPALEV
jgi:hypothetical protein